MQFRQLARNENASELYEIAEEEENAGKATAVYF
jgi:hypothetical protein